MSVNNGPWTAAEKELLKQRIRENTACIPISNELNRLTVDVRVMAAKLGMPLDGDESLLEERATAAYERHRQNIDQYSPQDPERKESYREYVRARDEARGSLDDEILPP